MMSLTLAEAVPYKPVAFHHYSSGGQDFTPTKPMFRSRYMTATHQSIQCLANCHYSHASTFAVLQFSITSVNGWYDEYHTNTPMIWAYNFF
ncbi:hypothetical protein E2C01_039571 [Portunus trituberculatus]|uniref:Uncharacterized protein n=1 Tax=Portunus trituberculatus TaxID=210409 RepID=A0A5B7FK70_PORTR|nr:hypothetical protein [Portunus trituberculatus]